MFDLIFRHATLVDGTGSSPRRADIGVKGERIDAVGKIPAGAEARTVFDIAGKVLCPGFVDIHTHSDLSLLADGAGESKLLQGVTTEVVGNCSFAAFPIEPTRTELHIDHLARVTSPVEPYWTDLDGYAEALEGAGLAINVAPLAGHGTLRVAAMGIDRRPPTVEELRRMVRDLECALDQGAFGMSTGLTHVPSAYADFDEVAALAQVLADREALYATHSRPGKDRERGALDEAVDTGRRTGVRVEFSHLAINHPDLWNTGDRLLTLFSEARESGVDIVFDVYPYHASSSSLTQYLPPWVQEGGTEAMRSRLANPATRSRALHDMTLGWFGGIPWLFDRFIISECPDGFGVARSLKELAAEAGADPYELTLELCERYGNLLQVVLFYRTEQDVRTFLADPLAVIGSDGNAVPLDQPNARPHPRFFGTFPRVLGRYVREKEIVTLEDAVRKMSGEPARRLGMNGRGVVRKGGIADLVVFDPDTVLDMTGFGQVPAAPTGIDLVVVAGKVQVQYGVVSPERPGRVLRKC